MHHIAILSLPSTIFQPQIFPQSHWRRAAVHTCIHCAASWYFCETDILCTVKMTEHAVSFLATTPTSPISVIWRLKDAWNPPGISLWSKSASINKMQIPIISIFFLCDASYYQSFHESITKHYSTVLRRVRVYTMRYKSRRLWVLEAAGQTEAVYQSILLI